MITCHSALAPTVELNNSGEGFCIGHPSESTSHEMIEEETSSNDRQSARHLKR